VIDLDKPAMRVYYELEEMGEPNLSTIITDFVKKNCR